jgi:hypothetical protein
MVLSPLDEFIEDEYCNDQAPAEEKSDKDLPDRECCRCNNLEQRLGKNGFRYVRRHCGCYHIFHIQGP